ncbi:unnamed protein product [Prorocentrum cordatum]|uniref:Uncharacterized protein n=1 Tax=Prorocentrum cordatum TaxID=2364126 RepID=A0ABN9RTV4_9DINO|nr:unnamed protein product [Polarella glacialis]
MPPLTHSLRRITWAASSSRKPSAMSPRWRASLASIAAPRMSCWASVGASAAAETSGTSCWVISSRTAAQRTPFEAPLGASSSASAPHALGASAGGLLLPAPFASSAGSLSSWSTVCVPTYTDSSPMNPPTSRSSTSPKHKSEICTSGFPALLSGAHALACSVGSPSCFATSISKDFSFSSSVALQFGAYSMSFISTCSLTLVLRPPRWLPPLGLAASLRQAVGTTPHVDV